MSATDPKRGEIWMVDLDPSRGSELRKAHPVVVLSSDSIRSLSVRVAVPLTGWQDHYRLSPWKVRVEPDARNRLTKVSAADSLQIRCLALDRFSKLTGLLPVGTLEEIVYAVNYCLDE